MRIRRAEQGDIEALMQLLEQVNLVHHEGRPDLFRLGTKYGEEELALLLQGEKTPVFVYEDETGRILGHAFCKVETVQNDRLLCDRRTLYIDDICVDAKSRGRHVGSALYAFVEAWAREREFDRITLNVWTCNPGAFAFYERLGLVPYRIGMEQLL